MPRTRAEQATSERGASALAVVLRREEQGPVIAVEFASGRDILDALAELWFEALLRPGHFDVPLQAVASRPEPILHRTEGGAEVCLGFSLTHRPAPDVEPVRCVFPRALLEPVAARAARRLLDAGVLASGDDYTYELRAEPAEDGFQDALAGRRARSGVSITVRDSAAASPRPFDVVRTPIAPLLEGAEAVQGEPAPGSGGERRAALRPDYPVFFTRRALAKAERVARKGASAQPAVETGGLLIGPLCFCPETRTLFAVVDDVLEATHSEATTYSLTYSGETWSRIQTLMRAKQEHPATRGQRILGQVHGHSFLPMEGAEPCAECATREVCTRTTAFLSGDDLAWCRAVFRGEPWQLSQIFGLNARNEGVEAFFGQRGGQLRARGYSIVERFEPAANTTTGR